MGRRSGGAGYALFDLKDADYLKRVISLVRWYGYPIRTPGGYGYGGGGYTQIGRLIVDGDGGGGGSSGEDARYQTALGEGFGGGQIGYALIDASWLRLYPLVGAGAAGGGAAAHAREAEDADVVGGSYGALLLIGLGIELRLPLSKHFRPLIGLRVGYRYRVVERVFGNLELPPKKRGEPFFRLIVGLGIER